MIVRLFCLLVLAVGTTSAWGSVVFFDPFDYPDGPLQLVSADRWVGHSGTTNQLSTEGGAAKLMGSRSQDVNAVLDGQPYAGSADGNFYLYASFEVKFTALPSSSGSYFAHFKDSAGGFRGRVWALQSGAAPGTFRLGITSSSGSSPPVIFERDLQLDTVYRVVVRLSVGDSVANLWIDPNSEDDVSVETPPGSSIPIAAFALRQATGIGTLLFDNLRVGTSFAELSDEAPPVLGSPDDSTGETETPPSPGQEQPAPAPAGEEPPVPAPQPGEPSEPEPGGNVGTNEPTEPGTVAVPDPVTQPPPDTQPNPPVSEPESGGNDGTPHPPTATPAPPVITLQPSAIAVPAGQWAELEARATGSEPLLYQWTFNGSDIAGANSAVLRVPDVKPADSGEYRVRVANQFGTATSAAAELVVTIPPASAPVQVILGICEAGNPVLQWQAEPHRSYSVLAASSLAGPFSPVATGLHFATVQGTFTDTQPVRGTIRFYRISAP